jgi:hypothetical protein
VTLAQAAWVTGDARYTVHCELLLRRWMDENPPKTGVHWASSLEVAFRSLAWLWVLALLGGDLPADARRRMLGHLAVSARHVERYLSTWFSPNTHLTGEALGLFLVGTALPGCPESAKWAETGRGILLDWLSRHVRPDGTYVEQSTWYHRYTTDFYLHFLILAGRAGLDVRGAVAGPLGGLLDVLAWITRPDGTMPLIGDDDGGRLLFLDEGTAHQTRTPLAVGAVLLGRSDLAGVAGAPTPELVWLLGPDAPARFAALSGHVPAGRGRSFPDGGVVVARSGWDRAASLLTIDAGPHGFLNGGHAHADALSLDLTVGGVPFFVDPGTYTYTSSPALRDRFRETTSHNAAAVDGCGSATASGPFSWASRADARCDAFHDAGDVVLFSGSHDGFARLRPPLRYVRAVAFVYPDLWIVRDELHGEGEHELAVHWQCAPGIDAARDRNRLTVLHPGGVAMGMHIVEPDGAWSIGREWVSPTYGVREEATHLRHVLRGRAPLAVTTVLCAGERLHGAVPTEGSGAVRGVEISWGDRRGLFATSGSSGPAWIDTDAAVLWIERHADHAQATAASVRRLSVSGRVLHTSDAPAAGVSERVRDTSTGRGGVVLNEHRE